MLRLIALSLLFAAPARAADAFKCRLAELRPTQLAVGMAEVDEKEKKLRGLKPKKLAAYERKNPEPVVRGPGGALYIIDHHHLALALTRAGATETFCSQTVDLSSLAPEAFWKEMEARKWVYAYDENGAGPRPYSELPVSVSGLKDDPYRSLAGAVRMAGGYDKTAQPFAEFQWADFFRPKFGSGELEKDFNKCVDKAVKIAHSPEAAGLPGHKKPK